MNSSCTLYLVRHGETEWNEKHLIQGHADIPLNEKGKKQAYALVEELSDVKFDVVYSSDLLRASQTAELFTLKNNVKLMTSKDLRERYFGKFQGRSFGNDKNLPQLINRLKQEKKGEIESDKELMKRFLKTLKILIKENIGKTILVVTHAGVIRTFLIYLKWGSYKSLSEGSIDNLAYVKLSSNGENFEVDKTSGISKILG